MEYDQRVALVRRAFEIWNARDLDAALEFVHPEIEWVSAGLIPDLDPVYRGTEGVKRFWRDFMEPWEEIQIEPERFVDVSDDELLVLAHFRARGRQGIELELRVGQLYRAADDGRVIRFQAFATYEEALEAVGADEPPS
ncbi:MAG: nuclear transport factor 2 family protein [Thermoleophilaceae bacterium]